MSDQDSTQMLNEYLKPLIIIGILNFVIGFLTWINGSLITFVKVAFSLNDLNSTLVLAVFYISYFVFSLPSLWVLKQTGTRKGLSLSLIVMAIGAAIFGQCIYSHWYPGTLSGLFVIGIGLCGLQTVVNPYASILGPIEKGAQRQAIMGICNKVAGISVPIIFGLIVTNISGIKKSIEVATSQAVKDTIILGFSQKIYYPYMGMALILLALSVGIYYSKLPEMKYDEPVKPKKHQEQKTKEGLGLPTSPRLWFGVLCIFMYVGVEVLAGSIIGTYGEGFNLSVDITKFLPSFTLIAMLFGYIVGIIVTPKWLSQETYLAISAILGIVLAIFAWCTTGYYSIACVALLGFANSMMWPAFFPIAIRGLGKQTTSGSALMVMGICGGAVIPEAFSYLKETFYFQNVFSGIIILGYLCIGCYGIYGYFSVKKDQREQASYETF